MGLAKPYFSLGGHPPCPPVKRSNSHAFYHSGATGTRGLHAPATTPCMQSVSLTKSQLVPFHQGGSHYRILFVHRAFFTHTFNQHPPLGTENTKTLVTTTVGHNPLTHNLTQVLPQCKTNTDWPITYYPSKGDIIQSNRWLFKCPMLLSIDIV